MVAGCATTRADEARGIFRGAADSSAPAMIALSQLRDNGIVVFFPLTVCFD
jgi:hypothetical protein